MASLNNGGVAFRVGEEDFLTLALDGERTRIGRGPDGELRATRLAFRTSDGEEVMEDTRIASILNAECRANLVKQAGRALMVACGPLSVFYRISALRGIKGIDLGLTPGRANPRGHPSWRARLDDLRIADLMTPAQRMILATGLQAA